MAHLTESVRKRNTPCRGLRGPAQVVGQFHVIPNCTCYTYLGQAMVSGAPA